MAVQVDIRAFDLCSLSSCKLSRHDFNPSFHASRHLYCRHLSRLHRHSSYRKRDDHTSIVDSSISCPVPFLPCYDHIAPRLSSHASPSLRFFPLLASHARWLFISPTIFISHINPTNARCLRYHSTREPHPGICHRYPHFRHPCTELAAGIMHKSRSG
ncbi:hypothetical protein P154DRAFT_311145 [Amniculicola lignicola CBS 123094]|uniref:Uncharacterized protein n=1 Tax=Amniculicola lignicola CBS 123094 TaxID=1392246 RepID=A0A6A5W6H4_9PLEO|nr:hypothetical protein P154DRAFT_311145 [Amniculicola lignicola CBS 123094]